MSSSKLDVEGTLLRLLAERKALVEALTAITEEVCDYARINDLGDAELKHNVRLARAALALTGGGQT